MSERGSGTPGSPPRIPGLPSNAHFFQLSQFRTLNAQRPRPAIEDQEMAWCQNLMPVGVNYLRAIPDKSSQIFGVPSGPPEAVELVGSISPPLALDGITNGRITQATVAPYTGTCGPLATTAADDVLVLIVSAEKTIGSGVTPPEIQSVASTSGLNWQRRYRIAGQVNSDFYTNLIDTVVEIWYAVSPHVLSAETVTVTYSEAINSRADSAIFGLFAVSGANIHAIWDGATQTADSNAYNVNVPLEIGGITTAGSNDLIFSFFVGYRNPVLDYALSSTWGELQGGPIASHGWVWAGITQAGANVGAWNQAVGFYETFNAPQTGLTAEAYGNNPFPFPAWIGVADAIRGYSGSPTVLTSEGLANLPATADTVLIAGWIGHAKPGTSTIISDIDTGGITLTVDIFGITSSTWTFTARQANGTQIVSATATLVADNISDGWHCYAVSMRASTQTLQIMVDAGLLTVTPTWSSSNPVGYPATDDWQVGPFAALADLSSLWFAAGDPFFDLSLAGNLAILFGSGAFCWKDWGPQGRNINGLQPQVFLYGDATSYAANRGSGGPFTVTGTALATVGGPTACT